MCDLIPRLKPRYRVVLASNTVDAHFSRYTADFADVLGHFDHLSRRTTPGAQAAPGVLRVRQRFAEAEPRECLFIDDLPANVEAATRFGWKGIVYRADGTLADKLAGRRHRDR